MSLFVSDVVCVVVCLSLYKGYVRICVCMCVCVFLFVCVCVPARACGSAIVCVSGNEAVIYIYIFV